jgi:hypothetical protein
MNYTPSLTPSPPSWGGTGWGQDLAFFLHFILCSPMPMKNDYIKQALVLEIERFKIFLTLTAVIFGSLLTLIQNQKNIHDQVMILIITFVLMILLGFSIKTHYDIEALIAKMK